VAENDHHDDNDDDDDDDDDNIIIISPIDGAAGIAYIRAKG
jgi:hypothetical protein